MASANVDGVDAGPGQFPLGFELYRGALQCVKSLETMHEDNLAWLDDYYETYVKSLSSSKDLVPKTPRRTRKRKATMDDKPAALPYPKRSTRAQGKDNVKNVPQLPAQAETPAAHAVVLHAATTSSLKVHEQRQTPELSGAAAPSELARAAVGAATTSPPALNDSLTSPATKCRVPIVRIAGFENMNVKSKALAYEALVSGKSDRTGTPGKSSVLTPDRFVKTPRSHALTPSHKTRTTKPDESSGSAKRTSTGRWLVTEMSDSAPKAKSGGSGLSATTSNDKSAAADCGAQTAAVVASSAKATTPGVSPRPPRASGTVATKPPVATSCGSPALLCMPSSSSKPSSKLSASLSQRPSAALRVRTSVKRAGSILRRSSARLNPPSREPSSSGTERSKKESSGRVAAEPGARDSIDSGYPESIRGGLSKTGKGSAAAEQDSCAVSTSVEQRDEASFASAVVSCAADGATSVPARGSASQLQTSDGTPVTDEPGGAAPCRQSPARALSSAATCKAAAQWGSHNGSPPKDDGVCVAVVPAATASCSTDMQQSNNPRSRTKVISRKEPTISAATVAAVQPQQVAEATSGDVRVTRSKMRVAKPMEAAPVSEPPTLSDSRSGIKRQSDDTSREPLPPAKLMREAIVSMPQIALSTFNALPTGSAMKKTATDSCLLSKKYYTPDNARTVGLTVNNSGQKTFLSASRSSSSLLNKSLTSPRNSRVAALVTTFVKRTAPVQRTSAVEKQKLKEKKLQDKEIASTENKKRRDDLLQERLDTIKRQREEKLKRAADLREQQEREKLEKQRLIEQKQAEKVEALYRAKESKMKEEKEKAKMRDLKLQEAEDRRKELELRQQKQKEEEEAARARRARELEEQERAAAAAALKASRAAAAENEQHRAQQEALRRGEKAAADRARAAAAAATAAASAAAGGAVRADHGGASSVQPCSVRVLVGTLSEKERLHEERKAQVIAEERRLLAVAAASSKAAPHLTTIDECPKTTSAESALKDSTNASSASAVATSEKSANPRLTITKVSSSADSYAITPPPPTTSRRRPLANPDNYDISDLNSGDETDDETRPRKVVPLWAQGAQLKLALVSQCTNPPDLDALFPESLRQPCDLAAVFRRNKPRYNKRTSSAVWDSPLLKLLPATTAAK